MLEWDVRRCPACGSLLSYWRRGLYYEHQRRCPECDHIWEPAEEYAKYQKQEQERLQMNTLRE